MNSTSQSTKQAIDPQAIDQHDGHFPPIDNTLPACKLPLKKPNPFGLLQQAACALLSRNTLTNPPSQILAANICTLFSDTYRTYSEAFKVKDKFVSAVTDGEFSVVTLSRIPPKLLVNILYRLLPNRNIEEILENWADNSLEGVIAWRKKKYGDFTYLFALAAKPDSLLKVGITLVNEAIKNSKGRFFLASTVLSRLSGFNVLSAAGFDPVGISFNLAPDLYGNGRETVINLEKSPSNNNNDNYNDDYTVFIPQSLNTIVYTVAEILRIKLTFPQSLLESTSVSSQEKENCLLPLLEKETNEFGIVELEIPPNTSVAHLTNLLSEINSKLESTFSIEHISLVIKVSDSTDAANTIAILNMLINEGYIFEKLLVGEDGVYLGMQKTKSGDVAQFIKTIVEAPESISLDKSPPLNKLLNAYLEGLTNRTQQSQDN